MKKFFILGACLWALGSTPVQAQTGEAPIVVRFYYEGSRLKAAIARGPGNLQVVETKGNIAEEAIFCQQVIAKLYQEGFSLKSTFGAGSSSTASLVFTKER